MITRFVAFRVWTNSYEFYFLFLFGSIMFSSSSAKLPSLKYISFFVTLTLWLRFITAGGSWVLVNQTGTIINLPLYSFQAFCSKGDSIFWCKDCNHILIWRLTFFQSLDEVVRLMKTFILKLSIFNSGIEITLFLISIIKGCSVEFFGIFNNGAGDLRVIS